MPYEALSPLLDAARDAARRGWRVFPLVPGSKRPSVRAWETRATTDPDRIARCWQSGPFNIGVATGPSALVVVDLDAPKDAGDVPPPPWAAPDITDGQDVFAALCEQHGQPYPANTYTVRTGSGGTHLYFTAPAGPALRNSAGKLGWKVDTRAGGGYVVGAGSTVDGRPPYTALVDVPPAPLPTWLAQLLSPPTLPPQAPVTVALASTDRRTAYLNAALDQEAARVRTSPPDGHNKALYLAAVALGQLLAGGELAEADVLAALLPAALAVGQGEREARATIASGLRAGARRPRTVARRREAA